MVAAKSSTLEKNQTEAILRNLYEQLEEWHNGPQEPKVASLEQVMTRNFELSSNGHVLSHNINEYLLRVEKLRKKYSKFSIKPSRDNTLVQGNKAALHYTLTLTPRNGGQPVSVEIMAIATLEGERISRWHQVAHEKGISHWDA
jgi:hypothetical protein